MLRVFFLICALSTPALAGGWTQPEGDYYAKTWVRGLIGGTAFLTDGSTAELPESFQDFALNLYGEYGLTDDLTLVLNATPIGYSKYADESATYVENLGGGLRYGVKLGEARLAVEARYGYAPGVGEDSLGEGVVDEEPFVWAPTVETQLVDGELQLGLPLSFGWLAFGAGARWYAHEDLDPALKASAQLGWKVTESWTLAFTVPVHWATGDIEFTNASGAGQTRYVGNSLLASYWFSPAWALTFGFEGAAYAASNAATPSLIFGVEMKSGG